MSSEPTAARPGPPPLRIYHFFVWMAVNAAWLAYWKSNVGDDGASAFLALFAIHFTFYTAGLTAEGFSIFWWWKGYAALEQPGQCLLLWYVVVFLAAVSRFILAHLSTGVTWRSPWEENLLLWEPRDFARFIRYVDMGNHILMGYGLPMLLYAWGAWRIAVTRPWRLFYLALLVWSLVNLTIYMGTEFFGLAALRGSR